MEWIWLWVLFVILLLVLPLAYGWGYRGWGPPPVPGRRVRRAGPVSREEAIAAEEEEADAEVTWGVLAFVVWFAFLVAFAWLIAAVVA